ncbi:HNH endonuclease, partial [Nostoc sp. CCCryo 231-06]|nr:HNH endonuclease [Nostoc sp. CCCryo 231-06]
LSQHQFREALEVLNNSSVVGKATPALIIKGVKPLLITANGHGSRQSCRTDKFGFPNRHVPRKKIHFGFQTGDIVSSVVTTGKKVGQYVGKVAIRSSGSFNISTNNGLIQGISHKFCKRIHAKDGYSYAI